MLSNGQMSTVKISQAQAKPMIEPRCVADDLGRKSIAMVGWFIAVHGGSPLDMRLT